MPFIIFAKCEISCILMKFRKNRPNSYIFSEFPRKSPDSMFSQQESIFCKSLNKFKLCFASVLQIIFHKSAEVSCHQNFFTKMVLLFHVLLTSFAFPVSAKNFCEDFRSKLVKIRRDFKSCSNLVVSKPGVFKTRTRRTEDHLPHTTIQRYHIISKVCSS